MGAAGAVLEAEALHLVAELAERRRRRATRQTRADDEHLEAPLVGGVDELVLEAGALPLAGDRPRRHARGEWGVGFAEGDHLDALDYQGAGYRTTPASTAMGKLTLPRQTTTAKAVAIPRRQAEPAGAMERGTHPVDWK